jgi:peptidoglycan hydrolase-like protein with peptidoglycan-binding domain
MKARTVVAGSAVVAVVAAGAWAAAVATPGAPARPAPAVSTATATVTRGDVTQRVQIAGTLGYDGSYSILSQLAAGILTEVAPSGRVVSRGKRLFAVAGMPATLLYGSVPAWRDLAPGMSDGADVEQLERNLVALGMDPSHLLRVDQHFSGATAAAIRRWQEAEGLPAAQRTGTVKLGQVVFMPGAIRVSQAVVSTGGSVGPGARVVSATSTSQVVTAPVTTDQRYLVHVGDRVEVTLPSAADPVAGRVKRIGRVASAPPAPGTPPSVPVTVTLPRRTSSSAALDQAPVQVAITVEQRHNVLLVPVTALLARTGGGYQVRVLDNGAARLIEVQPGLYDDSAGTVEVSGGDLRPGMTVEVPAG